MARSLTGPFTQEKNKQANSPIFLYTVFDYDDLGTNLYLAGYDEDVTFDGQTYQKFPIAHESVGENTIGEIDSVRISLSNVSRLIQSYLEQYEWRGKKINIIQVWANLLGDATAKLVDTYYIDEISADAKNVVVTCTSRFDVLDYKLPGMIYSRNHCRWKLFKGTECGYAGAATTCNRTWQRCGELNNRERFGGFPSIPPQRVILR